jgi:predicted transcriptional regulator
MSTTRSVRLDKEANARLMKLAKASDRPLSWHIEQAVSNYLELKDWQLRRIEESMRQIEEGDLIPHEVVKKRMMAYARKLDAKVRTKASKTKKK